MKRAMTGRGMIWLLALAAMLIIMIRTASVWPAGIIAILVLLPPVSLIWAKSASKQTEIHIRMPAGARKNENAEGQITLRFNGSQPPGSVYVRLEVKNDLTGENSVADLPAKGTENGRTAKFIIKTAHCGRITCTVRSVVLTDHFGFIPVRLKTHAEGRVTVMPDTFPVDIDPYLLTSPKDGDETRPDRKGNDMTEIFQLREYQPGDNLHGIHWKLSGKLDQLIYRDPAQQVSNALLMYWDQSEGRADQLDALAEAMFSVGQRLCEMGVPFTVGRSVQGTLKTGEVSDLEHFIEHFPALLNRQISEPAGSDELTAFGRVFYFTAAEPAFDRPDIIKVFLCAEGGAGLGETVFTPFNAEEKLERIEIYEGA